MIVLNPAVHNETAVVSGFVPLMGENNDTHNTDYQMIIKSFIYGFEKIFLHQLYSPNYVLLEIPQVYICRLIQIGGFSVSGCFRVEENCMTWNFKNSCEYTTVT